MSKRRYKKTSSVIAKRRNNRRYMGIFLKISLPVAFFVGLIFILRADFLQVKNFEVFGTKTVKVKSVKDVASSFVSGTDLLLLPRSNILFLSKGDLRDMLLSKFGRLQNIDIDKQLFSRSIILSVSERTEDFLWCSSQEACFFMTKDGFIFEQSNFTSQSGSSTDKIIFKGLIDGSPLLQNFSTPIKMQSYLGFIEIFKKDGFQISSINIESPNKATAKSNTGDIIFNPEEANLSTVAQNVVLLINDAKNKTPSAKFNYIDARFGNKIFYKLY